LHYTIYKTTNLINGKFYIGKHQTKNLNDDYIGSGKYLKSAIKKYGLNNFYREILYVYDTEKKMNLAEKILVVCDLEISYNICSGGQGGFSFINQNNLNKGFREYDFKKRSEIRKGKEYLTKIWKDNPQERQKFIEKVSLGLKKKWAEDIPFTTGMLGKKHSNETKKMSESRKGKEPWNKGKNLLT
jgi:hypothetical protein